MFLPDASSCLLYEDYQLKPPWKTLAYAQALQYWAEKSNLPVPGEPHHLAMSIHELRWHIRYTTFSDHDVFEGPAHKLPEAEVEETTQPNPIEPPVADSPAVLATAPSEPENVSAALIATPATSEEESVALVIIPAALVDELADPATPLKTAGNARSPTKSEYPRWVKVHSSHMVASVGSIPCNPGDLRWCHHNHSSSQQKRAWHLLEEEQQVLSLPFNSALSGSSPEPAPQEEEDLGAKPKVPPLGFQEIARSLTTGKFPKMEDDSPWTRVSHKLSVEPAVATVISTTMCQDQTMGAVYLSTITTSMGLMNLEAPSAAVGHQGLTLEELKEEDLAEGHP